MTVSRSLSLMAGVMALSMGALAQDGLPTQKMLTIDVAQTIAQDAMAQCRANGFKVTVTVVDSANVLKAFLRDDGASMATVEVGRMKANSVMAFGRPSGPPANLPPGTPAPPPVLPGTINAMGGVPIKVGDQLIGAVSVSGAPGGDKDAACANSALAKVAEKLK
ncbi:MAG TPA: heme-binding protein [Bryobacteraceae bacterium]|jgi:uncharacterized protein GlcG (DUF336 family)|nr:heme-binding protein [Bryobacteraceae bacterium]